MVELKTNSIVKPFSSGNSPLRTLAIGDVHGCFDQVGPNHK